MRFRLTFLKSAAGLPMWHGMADDRLMDPAGRDAVLAATLAQHPDAFIAAVSHTGLFAPLPEELAATGLRPVEGPSSMLGLVLADDQRIVVETWYRALNEGVANCLVRLLAAPERQVRLHLIDLTHRLGVHVAMISGIEDHAEGLALAHDEVRPRLVTVRKDQTAVITEAGPEVSILLGWSPAELVGMRSLELIHPGDHERAIASWMDMLSTPPGAARRVRLRHLHRDGHAVWFEITNHNHLADPERPVVVAEMLDISDEMAAQEAVRATEQLLRRLTETLPLGILQIDADRRITYLNDRAARSLRARAGDVLGDQLDAIVPADRPAADDAIAAVLGSGADVDLEYGSREPGRGVRRIRANLRALTGDDDTVSGAIICLADVTEDVRLRDELRHRATFDPLTGCHNRAATMAALQETLAAGARAGTGTAVVFLDLNGFKQINDRYGHAAGDRLLTQVSTRLRLAVPPPGLVGRIGGDEFLVILQDVAGSAEAARIGAGLLPAVGEDEGGVPRASVGVAWSAPGADTPDELIARADAAMYEAKAIHKAGHPARR